MTRCTYKCWVVIPASLVPLVNVCIRPILRAVQPVQGSLDPVLLLLCGLQPIQRLHRRLVLQVPADRDRRSLGEDILQPQWQADSVIQNSKF